MGLHTESYKLVVTDHVPGREGIARSFTGWESDPEGAIAAWHQAADNAADGTTVDLIRIETTSVMHQVSATRPETAKRYADRPHPQAAPPVDIREEQEQAQPREGTVWDDNLEPVPVSPYAAYGDAVQVTLTPPMVRALGLARNGGGRIPREDVQDQVKIGTIVALIDRGLMGSVDQGVEADTLTERGRRLADLVHGEMDLGSWIANGSVGRYFDIPES